MNQHKSESHPEDHPSELLVSDIARYLARLARLQQDEMTGNAGLSRGLSALSRALTSRSELSLSEVTRLIRGTRKPTAARPKPRAESELTLPADVAKMRIEELERFLDGRNHSKNQLIELGFQRFGISRSKLSRLNKDEAMGSIRSALEHEKSLETISREASGTKTNRRRLGVQKPVLRARIDAKPTKRVAKSKTSFLN